VLLGYYINAPENIWILCIIVKDDIMYSRLCLPYFLPMHILFWFMIIWELGGKHMSPIHWYYLPYIQSPSNIYVCIMMMILWFSIRHGGYGLLQSQLLGMTSRSLEHKLKECHKLLELVSTCLLYLCMCMYYVVGLTSHRIAVFFGTFPGQVHKNKYGCILYGFRVRVVLLRYSIWPAWLKTSAWKKC